MNLRRATLSDAPAIAGLHAASWRAFYRGALSDDYLNGNVIADRISVWSSRLSVHREEQLVLLAEAADGLLGFSCAYLGADPIWGSLLDNLHVSQQHHRCGVGKTLLAQTRAWIWEHERTDLMHLWVLQSNARARMFYEAQKGRIVEEDQWLPPGGGVAVPRYRMAWGEAFPYAG